MHLITERIELLGRREATTVAASTNQRVFASLSGAVPVKRQGVSVCNQDAVAELWVRITRGGADEPTISSTDSDFVILPRTSRLLPVGAALEVWVRSSSASNVSYTAVELL